MRPGLAIKHQTTRLLVMHKPTRRIELLDGLGIPVTVLPATGFAVLFAAEGVGDVVRGLHDAAA
jgi:hypothetical protein